MLGLEQVVGSHRDVKEIPGLPAVGIVIVVLRACLRQR
jgi:hypothetical protein